MLLPAMASLPAGAQPCCGPVTPNGERLLQRLNTSGVDHLWLPYKPVNWETGQIDNAASAKRAATHCSAFVASFSKQLGIYILRPPEHSPTLLANAQMRWLADEGAARGWRPMSRALEAQEAANHGRFVVASYANPDAHRPGHIAVLRPSLKSGPELERDGPQVTQAGNHNYLSTTMRRGFGSHPGAWETGGRGAAVFFAHQAERWPQA